MIVEKNRDLLCKTQTKRIKFEKKNTNKIIVI